MSLRRTVRRPGSAIAGHRLRGRRLERRMVWMMGTPRSGSTWLYRMLGEMRGIIPVHEPMIGAHLGLLSAALIGVRPPSDDPGGMRVVTARADRGHYFFSDAYRGAWQPALRDLLLRRIGAQARDSAYSRRVTDPLVLIKEPNGSEGADVLMSALPRSRLLVLLRDGRDVVDSLLDATRDEGWLHRAGFRGGSEPGARLELIHGWAHAWVARTDAVLAAYDAHDPGLRIKLRYEDLLADPCAGLVQISGWLGRPLANEEAGRIAAAHSYGAASEKGEGHHVRSASPGAWREHLSSAEQQVLTELLADRLERAGYRP